MAEENPKTTNANGAEIVGGNRKESNMEPSENDPCMGDNTKPKSRFQFLINHRDSVCKKTGLTHNGFHVMCGVCVLCFVLFIIVVALGAAWPHIPHRYQFPVCKEAACLRTAAQINEALDDSWSPCNNLWEWSCGGWLKNNPLPKDEPIWNQKQQLLKQETERVRDVIATLKLPPHTNTGSVEWKLKRLYEACMDENSIYTDVSKPLRDIISNLGGWYILKDWNKYDFDMNVLLEKLHVRYGVSPYFKISVEPHPLNPNENGIRIGPGGLGLPNKEYYYTDDDKIYQTAYQSLIREVVINFGASAVDANKFGTDLFSYEKRIAEITPNLETLQNPISIYNTRRLSELMNDITNIKFDEILIAMFPESNITESTEIIITSEKYLTDISQIIASTNNQLLNSYLIWTLVHHYVPYLSDDFVTTIDSYKTQILGVQPDGKEKWEVCSLLTKRFMGFALDVFIDKQDPIDNEVKSTINNTFHSILSVVKKKMRFVENEPLLYKYLKQKFSTIQLQIGLPDVVKEETYLKKYFTQLKVIKTDLFQSILNSVLFERKLKEKRLNKRLLEDTLLYYLSNNEVPKVQYLASENIVFVPRILLSKTLIEDKSPKAVVYGRIGIEIAEAILSSILPYGSFWSANKKILSPFHSIVNDSIISIESQRKCLFDYILGFNLDLPYSLANETALNLFKHVSAVSVANEALINSLVNEQHIHQPSLENFEDTALFFLTYSQTQCSESTSQYQFYRKVSHFELPQRTFLLIVWSQLQKFPSAFQCSGFKKNQQCSDIF